MTKFKDKQGREIPDEAFENDATVLGTSGFSAANSAALDKKLAAIKAAVLKKREGR